MRSLDPDASRRFCQRNRIALPDGAAVQKVLPFVANHYSGTQVQTYLDANGDQAIALLDIYKLKADGSDYDKVGTCARINTDLQRYFVV